MMLRDFQPDDVESLTRLLHRAYAELGTAGMNFTAVDQDHATTLRRASAGRSWVLEDRGELIAAMTISWPAEQTLRDLTAEASVVGRAWLNQLAVDPSRRGEGLARTLRDVGYDWSRSVGATSIGLDTAMPAHHLVQLYSEWGFERRDVVQWPGKTYESVVMVRAL